MILAYKHSDRFKLSKVTWNLLFLTYTFFVMRELIILFPSDAVHIIKRMFGSFSAIAMASTFYFMYLQIYQRKVLQKHIIIAPFAIIIVIAITVVHLLYSTGDIVATTTIMTIVEKILWILAGLSVAYHTYLLGSKMSAGRFLRIFMLFNFSAIFAIMWAVLGLADVSGGHAPEFITEGFEFLFMAFSGAAIYTFMQVLKGD